MQVVMVTGINGFVGKHLARELHSRAVKIIGIGRENDLSPEIKEFVETYYVCDLTNKDQVDTLPVQDVNAVVNLAGFAKVGASYDNQELYMKVNVGVLTFLAEKLIKDSPETRMIAVSTGAVYSPDQSLPLQESSDLVSNGSPYALSKIAMEFEAERMRKEGLRCIVVRPFNHIGPGQEPGFLLPDLYEKLLSAYKNNNRVPVGDLTTRRDYTDVRDVVRAYADLALITAIDGEVFNISSGKSISGTTILSYLQDSMNLVGKVETMIDENLIRKNDPRDIYGDFSALATQTSWSPTIPIRQTIQDFVRSKTK